MLLNINLKLNIFVKSKGAVHERIIREQPLKMIIFASCAGQLLIASCPIPQQSFLLFAHLQHCRPFFPDILLH